MGRPVTRNSPASFLRDLKKRLVGGTAPPPGSPGVQYTPTTPVPMGETELMQKRQQSPVDRKRQLEEMLREGR